VSIKLTMTDHQKETARLALEHAEATATRPAYLADVQPRPFKKTGVIGGGTMGAGIAVALLNAGLSVTMIERDAESVARGRANVTAILDRDLARGRIDASGHAARISAFVAGSEYELLKDIDLVIEAVFEDIAVKRDVFQSLSDFCRTDAILASNTSYLNPETIFAGFANPERFIGLHFFSPANIMKLLEIVPASQTAPEVLATAFALADACRKMPVRAGICDGFIGNRILKIMRQQAEQVLIAGATPSQVDEALVAFGMKMGPFAAQDLSGLDIAAYQRKAAKDQGLETFAPIGDLLVAAGRLGRKTNAGWYDYADGTQIAQTPHAVCEALNAARSEANTTATLWHENDIVEAILFPMINEAANIVHEGIALSQDDVDLVEIHGYGFPRARGGLIQFGRMVGFDKIATRLTEFHRSGVTPPPGPELCAWAEV
jgi:3-hydroxyacyl-CoA dehydrogenase